MDEFFIRALLAGVAVALLSGPLGCIVVWRRMAYFGDALAHAAFLGAAFSLLFDIPMIIGVFSVAILIALALLFLQKRILLPPDTLLGTLGHASLASALVLISFMVWLRIDLLGILFGDILSVSWSDVAVIYSVCGFIAITLLVIWRRLLVATIHQEISEAENMKPLQMQILFMILIAAFIAMAIKIVGILLITALLIIPAAAARAFAKSPEQMALLAAFLAVLSVVMGLSASLAWDIPAGPGIVLAGLLFFLFSLLRLSPR